MNIGQRTRDACVQLTRYNAGVYDENMVSALEALVEINDDLYHLRDPATAIANLRYAISKLYKVSSPTHVLPQPVVQFSAQNFCCECRQRWDVNDPQPPRCTAGDYH